MKSSTFANSKVKPIVKTRPTKTNSQINVLIYKHSPRENTHKMTNRTSLFAQKSIEVSCHKKKLFIRRPISSHHSVFRSPRSTPFSTTNSMNPFDCIKAYSGTSSAGLCR